MNTLSFVSPYRCSLEVEILVCDSAECLIEKSMSYLLEDKKLEFIRYIETNSHALSVSCLPKLFKSLFNHKRRAGNWGIRIWFISTTKKISLRLCEYIIRCSNGTCSYENGFFPCNSAGGMPYRKKAGPIHERLKNTNFLRERPIPTRFMCSC